MPLGASSSEKIEGYMPTIVLRDGTELKPDWISYIAFDEDGRVAVNGWKDGLNQTLDEFQPGQIAMIRFERNDGP